MIKIHIEGASFDEISQNLSELAELFADRELPGEIIPVVSPPVSAIVQPVAPAQPAPLSTVAPEPVSGAIVLDVRGFPWDQRIHSESIDKTTGDHKLNADGTWRYRRNTPKELIVQVEAEHTANGLLAIVDAPPVTPTLVPPVAGGNGVAPTMPAVVPGVAPGVTFEQPPQVVSVEILMQRCMALLTTPTDAQVKQKVAGEISQMMLQFGIVNADGQPDSAALASYPQQWEAVFNQLTVIAQTNGVQL